MTPEERTVKHPDDNIHSLRQKYPDGLHFVVGDTHCAFETLKALMEKIAFDPQKDHVYLVGDYTGGDDTTPLLTYLSAAYQADLQTPGFHLIRGNHERYLSYHYPLRNLPDLFVLKFKHMTYYLAHAGMVSAAFDLINQDMQQSPQQTQFSYALTLPCTDKGAPLRQLTWSSNGLYSRRAYNNVWPSKKDLQAHHACIIHGHTPYSYMMGGHFFSPERRNLFWQNQHIWFSESLQSFDIDSDVKGKHKNGETYRGLACLCLEICEEIAAQNGNYLTLEGVRDAQNFVFGVPYCETYQVQAKGNLDTILNARPQMKTIALNSNGVPYIV